jgi:hypothetical protein
MTVEPSKKFSRRELGSEIRAVQIECSDGFGGTTPGVMGTLFRFASVEISRAQTVGGVFVGVGYEADDDRAVLRLFFEYEDRA